MKPFYIFLLIVVIGLLLVAAVDIYFEHQGVSNAQYMSQESLNSLNAPTSQISIVPESSTIYINGSTAFLVELSPSMGKMNSTPQEYFMMYGLVNPRLIIEKGVIIKFVIVNMDGMEHNMVISRQGPPYGYGSMMGSDGMDGSNYMMTARYLPPYGGSGIYPYENISYQAFSSGTYWYLCTYPGHAQEGMYGQIIIY